MSIKLMTHVWEHSPQTKEALLLLLAFADAADDDGYCWPSQTRLAKKTRLTDRAVRALTRRLEEAGEVEIVEPYDAKSQRSQMYRVRCVCWKKNGGPPERGSGAPPERRSGPSGTGAHNPPAPPLKEEPSVEPSKKSAHSLWVDAVYSYLGGKAKGISGGKVAKDVKAFLAEHPTATTDRFPAFVEWFKAEKGVAFTSGASLENFWGEFEVATRPTPAQIIRTTPAAERLKAERAERERRLREERANDNQLA